MNIPTLKLPYKFSFLPKPRYRARGYYILHHTLPLSINGTIVDIETTGLEPSYHEIIGIGIISKNIIKVIVKTHNFTENFTTFSKNLLKNCPRPLIAYNKFFEENFLTTTFDIDIQPQPFLAKHHAISITHIHYGLGKHCPTQWEKKNYSYIFAHLISDLFEELALYSSLSHNFRSYNEK